LAALWRRPAIAHDLAVAALWLGTADRDQLEAVGTGVEGADDLGGNAHDVPLAQLDRLVVELDATGAGNDDVGLLLDLVNVAVGGDDVGVEALVRDAELGRSEMLAGEADLALGGETGRSDRLATQ
jgi:hypothetical protein